MSACEELWKPKQKGAMRDFGRMTPDALQCTFSGGHQSRYDTFTHTLVFNNSFSKYNLPDLGWDITNKTPTWCTSCLHELPRGCLHVPVALSEQCDFLPVSPSSLTPKSPPDVMCYAPALWQRCATVINSQQSPAWRWATMSPLLTHFRVSFTTHLFLP